MAASCRFCGVASLSWEGDCQLVCTACGAVIDSNCLVNDEGPRGEGSANYAGNDYRPTTARERQNYAARQNGPSISKGRRAGIAITKQIAQCLECKSSMRDEAVQLFERIVAHPYYRPRQAAAKRALAACSIYIICRQYRWPISLGDVCQYAMCSPAELDCWKKKVLNTFDDLAFARPPDLVELVEFRCKKSGLSDVVQQRTVQMISLCRELWISEGCRPDNIISVVCFLAWQSEDPIERCQMKLVDFCKTYQLVFSPKGMPAHLRNIKLTLCHLANQIPWVPSGSVNERNFVRHIADVLQFQSTLIADARSQLTPSNDCELNDDNDDDNDAAEDSVSDCVSPVEANYETNGTRQISSDSSASEVVIKYATSSGNLILQDDGDVEFSNIVQQCVASGDSSRKDLANGFVSSQNSKKNVTIKPIMVKKRPITATDLLEPSWQTWPKKFRVGVNTEKAGSDDPSPNVNHPDMDATELTCHDIPDSELHLYIKSNDQILELENP